MTPSSKRRNRDGPGNTEGTGTESDDRMGTRSRLRQLPLWPSPLERNDASSHHLGLYKALATAYCNSNEEFANPADSDDPFDIPTQEKADQILHLIHGLAMTAAARGFYLRRWIQVINVMIYKKPGVIESDKLRVIHLFEADFNLLIGVYFGRRSMYHQVDRKLLHHGQFGKPGGECQDAALSKVLHNVISILTKPPMGKFESDVTACFDREVMDEGPLVVKR
jgi:hypothetical protein